MTTSENKNVPTKGHKNQLKSKKAIIMIIAEFIGTASLVFFGCMGCIDWIKLPGLPISAPLNFGLTVMFVIQIFGHISFAIINPAVAIAAVVHKLISLKLAILFIISEVIGALFGYGMLKVLTPQQFLQSTPALCVTSPHPSITTAQTFFIEFFLTFALVMVVSGAWDARNKKNSDSVSIRIGLTVVALSLAGGTATGASMNPARTFGPAFWNQDFTAHWIYWLAPMSASFIAATLYRKIFNCEEESQLENEGEMKISIKSLKYNDDDDDTIELTMNIHQNLKRKQFETNKLVKNSECNIHENVTIAIPLKIRN